MFNRTLTIHYSIQLKDTAQMYLFIAADTKELHLLRRGYNSFLFNRYIMDKLPKSYKKLSKKQLRDQLLRQMNDNIFIVAENYNLNQAITIQSKTIEHLMDQKDRVKELREDMRDAVVDQPSFLDLYKGVSPHT